MNTPLSTSRTVVAQQRPISTKDHVVFAAATLLYWATMYIYVPILTPFLEDRGLPLGTIGLIVGSYGLTQVLIRFPLGLYSDRLSRRKPFLFAGMAAGLLSCALFLYVGGWAGPLSGRLVAGICASTWVPFTVLYASYYPPAQSGKAMSTLSFLTVVGQLGGMTLSGYLAGSGDWNAAFAAGIVIAAAGGALVAFVREPRIAPAADTNVERSVVETSKRPTLAILRESRQLQIVSLLSLLAHCVLFITMFGFTPLQAVEFGAGKNGLTVLVVSFMVPHALVSLWTGRYIAPRFGTRRVLLCGFLLAAVCTALIPFSGSFVGLLATQAVNGVAQGLYLPLLLGLAIKDIRPSERATAMGFYQSVYAVGMFAGPYLAGWLNAGGGLKAGFGFGAAIAVAAAVVARLAIKGERAG
ncbi:Predicted arabinose efflux permease, MFS family [Cohnella sp. OV330]|uniref:MFS transporter n=1 Tax=Cohnella sp. OV330 TaxID=1855288 RepID=UPI0008EEFB7A|nr:MFS transporter [Cohnella sp. OV330]SFB43521.1 Predicted arabinose efflux permease, MFS family [Cohnella sp. OV330]